MNSTGLFRRISGAALTLAMIVGLNIATSPSAQAQWRDDRNRGYNNDQVRWSRDRTTQYARLLGYHNAYTEGKEAAEIGRRINYRDIQEYRDATNGWLSWMGYVNDYKSAYRRGFEEGFRDGQSGRNRRVGRDDVERVLGDRMKSVYGGNDDDYDNDRWRRGRGRDDDRGRGNWGRNDRNDIIRIAQQNGYREGFSQGQDDRSHRRDSRYDRDSVFRDAMRGYRSEYGDRGFYQQNFREGFRRGYEDAFRGRANSSGRWPF